MVCKACNKVSYRDENEDCFENALSVLKKHYTYYKNAIQQRDLELQQVKERNEKLNKALQLLQKDQHNAKRFKFQQSSDSWVGNKSSEENCASSELDITYDEPGGVSKLNMALNSEELFDSSSLSQNKNDANMISSSEIIQNPRTKESPKRNKQRDATRGLKDHNNKNLGISKSEWHTKERNPGESSWAMKFLQPTKIKMSEEKSAGEGKKAVDKKLCLSLKKTNPSKMKQSIIHFTKSKETSIQESDIGEDIIDASPVVVTRSSKAGRTWTHRSGNNHSVSKDTTNEPVKKSDDYNSLDDIVFDFSPSKKANLSQNVVHSSENLEPKKLKFEGVAKDCITLPNNNLGILTDKSESSSVVILTPRTEDIIFLDDTNIEPEIDTLDLLADIMKQGSADSLDKLKTYESKCIKKQQTKESDLFKKPASIFDTKAANIGSVAQIKQEKATEEMVSQKNKAKEAEEEKPSNSHIKTTTHKNPLLSSDEHDTEDDDDFMPKPFVLKEERESSKSPIKLSIKQRFNIDCEDCEKVISFLDKRLTDAQIKEHLRKCKRHNNPDIMRLNTPTDFWNPFILSFQADDPRNEVLIDNRFKDNKKY